MGFQQRIGLACVDSTFSQNTVNIYLIIIYNQSYDEITIIP